MTVTFELRTELAVSPAEAFDLARSIDVHVGSMAASSERAIAGVTTGRISLGETVTWRAVHFGIPFRLQSRITAMSPPHSFTDEQVRGPFRHFRHDHELLPSGEATEMVDRITFAAPFGPLGLLAERLILARYLRRLIERRNKYLASRAG